MAGRILPLALAAIVGVSIGVATFDREFQEQRRKRLQEEYDQEVAALKNQSTASNALPPANSLATQVQQQAKQIDVNPPNASSSDSSWSSMLGLWAWKKSLSQSSDKDNTQSKP